MPEQEFEKMEELLSLITGADISREGKHYIVPGFPPEDKEADFWFQIAVGSVMDGQQMFDGGHRDNGGLLIAKISGASERPKGFWHDSSRNVYGMPVGMEKDVDDLRASLTEICIKEILGLFGSNPQDTPHLNALRDNKVSAFRGSVMSSILDSMQGLKGTPDLANYFNILPTAIQKADSGIGTALDEAGLSDILGEKYSREFKVRLIGSIISQTFGNYEGQSTLYEAALKHSAPSLDADQS